nr:SDR family NAD(P)-dependent oxidoreductase [Rathayibacter sp. VKM Ac-2929]
MRSPPPSRRRRRGSAASMYWSTTRAAVSGPRSRKPVPTRSTRCSRRTSSVDLIMQVLPQMRARRAGTIVNVSSIAAPRSGPASGYYSATKAALEGVSDALYREVGPLGVRVVVIEPGGFRTDFAGRSLTQSRTIIDDYAETAGRRRKENDTTHGTQPGDPDRAARAIVQVVRADSAPFRLLLGSDAVDGVQDALRDRLAEIARWAPLSTTTDFD